MRHVHLFHIKLGLFYFKYQRQTGIHTYRALQLFSSERIAKWKQGHLLNPSWSPESNKGFGAASDSLLDQWEEGNAMQGLPDEQFQNNAVYPCPFCSGKCSSESNRQNHIAIHHPQRLPYICTICGKGFQSSGGFYAHKATHMGRSFLCSICSAKFVHKHHLKRHLNNIHKLTWCLRCSGTFALGQEYDNHVMICQ